MAFFYVGGMVSGIIDRLTPRDAASDGFLPPVYLPRDVIQPEIRAHVVGITFGVAIEQRIAGGAIKSGRIPRIM